MKGWENGLKLCQRRFRSDIRKNFSKERAEKPWKRLPKEAVEWPFLRVFKKWLNMALSALAWLTVGWSVEGQTQLSWKSFPTKWFCDSECTAGGRPWRIMYLQHRKAVGTRDFCVTQTSFWCWLCLRILPLTAVHADFCQSPWLWTEWGGHSPPCLTNIKGISALIKNEST